MISVIVPVYKVEPYLRECIESILNQTYRDFELILVDDGSPDNCGAICDEYAEKDPRIRVIHQANGGLSAARNAGLDVAKGEYVTFVDSDDVILENYLRCLYSLVQKTGCDISTCDFCVGSEMEQDDTASEQQYATLPGKIACFELYKQSGIVKISAWGKLYTRHLWESVRFPVGKIHEDQAVVPILLYKANEVTVSQERLYFYRIVENSIMHRKFSLKRYDDVEAVEQCVAFFEDMKEWTLAELAKGQRERILAAYSIAARESGIYELLPKGYRMSEWKALRILRRSMTDDKYTFYLAKLHPNWLRPHAYLRKIKKILHIPCN